MLLDNLSYKVVLEILTMDYDDGWKTVAAEIGFNIRDIARIGSQPSPTEYLLQEWGSEKEVTVWDLYKVLHKVGRYEEMGHLEKIIKEENYAILPIPGGIHCLTENNEEFIDEINPNDLPPPSKLVPEQYPNNPPSAIKSVANNFKSHDNYATNPASKQKYSINYSDVNVKMLSLQNNLSDMNLMINMDEVTCAYSYEDIEHATKSFSQCIGKGTFGSVYYGVLTSSKCAVKKLSKDLNGTNKTIHILKKNPLDEMKILLRYRHDNIINIYGYCFHKDDIYFVYEFMDRGSLQDCLLNDNDCFNWAERLNIAKGIACGLHYLHSQSVTHGDIKSCNILINKHKEAKIGDLGLAEFVTDHSSEFLDRVSKQMNPKLFGTLAYLPPEFGTSNGKRFLETDVYSYGVVLLEIITGKLAFDDSYVPKTLVEQIEISLENKPKQKWFQESDKRIECESKNLIINLFDLAFKCISQTRKHRPKMGTVVEDLICFEKEFMRDIANNNAENVPDSITKLPYQSSSEVDSLSSNSCNNSFTSSEPYQLQRSWDEKNKIEAEKKAHSMTEEKDYANKYAAESDPDEGPSPETCTSRHAESVSEEGAYLCQGENAESGTESDEQQNNEEISESIQNKRYNFFKDYEAKKSIYTHDSYDQCQSFIEEK